MNKEINTKNFIVSTFLNSLKRSYPYFLMNKSIYYKKYELKINEILKDKNIIIGVKETHDYKNTFYENFEHIQINILIVGVFLKNLIFLYMLIQNLIKDIKNMLLLCF